MAPAGAGSRVEVAALALLLGIIGKAIDDMLDMHDMSHGDRALELFKVLFVLVFALCLVRAGNVYVTAGLFLLGAASALICPDEYFHDPYWTSTLVVTVLATAYAVVVLGTAGYDPDRMVSCLTISLLLTGIAFAPDMIAAICSTAGDDPSHYRNLNEEVSEKKMWVRFLGAITGAGVWYWAWTSLEDPRYRQGVVVAAAFWTGYYGLSFLNQRRSLVSDTYTVESNMKRTRTKEQSLRDFSHGALWRRAWTAPGS